LPVDNDWAGKGIQEAPLGRIAAVRRVPFFTGFSQDEWAVAGTKSKLFPVVFVRGDHCFILETIDVAVALRRLYSV
jgi:hypothetical protein